MNIDSAIRIFADFLNLTWITVDPLTSGRDYTSDESSKSDWVQANWELLVERKVLPLNNYLDVYGEGADFNGSSSRITDVDSYPTFSVCVIVDNADDVLNNQGIYNSKYFFDRFVGFVNGFYVDSSPFEYVLIHDDSTGMERVFFISDVKFELQEIK